MGMITGDMSKNLRKKGGWGRSCLIGGMVEVVHSEGEVRTIRLVVFRNRANITSKGSVMRQVTSTSLTGYGEKVRRLTKAGIKFEARDGEFNTTLHVTEEDFERANAICMGVSSHRRKINRGWRSLKA